MHKVFDTQRRAFTGEKITFEMPPGSGQTYECLPDAPGAFLIDVASLSDPDLDLRERVRIMGHALEMVLPPESLTRFEAAFRSSDPNVNITLGEAMSVLVWLVSEVYVGRPTEPAATWSESPPPTGPPSTVNGPTTVLTH